MLTDVDGDRVLLDPYKNSSLIDECTSPFLYATMEEGLGFLALMLYESGAASVDEIFNIFQTAESLEEYYREEELPDDMDFDDGIWNCIQMLPFLCYVATTPRSLKSSCRLAISRCLDPRGRREQDVETLPVLSAEMKNYVLFSDLAHMKPNIFSGKRAPLLS